MTKFTRTYEDEDSITVWTYDLEINPFGPIEVDTTYKNNYDKTWEQRQNTFIKMRRIQKREKRKNK